MQGPHAHEIGAHHVTARAAVAAIRAFLGDGRRLTATVHVYGPDMRLFKTLAVGGERC